jgi:nucleoside-diphosphate-sugar epimerase
VSLRVFNPIGAGAQGESLLVRAAERIVEALRDDLDEVRMGPLSAWRDLVDARDVATAVAAAVTVPVLPAPVVNVGRGQAVRSREVVAALAGVAGFAGRVVEDLVPPGRSRGVDWTCADTTLAEQGLGWWPRYGLSDAVEAVWRDVGARAPADAA